MLKKETRALWEQCFTDSEAFNDLYFSLRYTEERNRVILHEGKPIAALQLLPYPLKFGQTTLATRYISGACTAPEHRSKGVMKKLLIETFNHLQQKGIPIATLIPAEEWLFDYYGKFDFATVFYNESKSISQIQTSSLPSNLTIVHTEEFNVVYYNYLKQYWKSFSTAILHSEADFKVVLADLKLGKGKVFLLKEDEEVKGVSIASVYKEETIIHELALLKEHEPFAPHLINQALQYFNTKKGILLHSPKKKKRPLGMLRIVDALAALKAFAQNHPEVSFSLLLEDSIIPKNTGLYMIHKGECVKHERVNQKAHLRMNIKELAAALFLPTQPYMSLMLN